MAVVMKTLGSRKLFLRFLRCLQEREMIHLTLFHTYPFTLPDVSLKADSCNSLSYLFHEKISAEAPSFNTAAEEKEMQIIGEWIRGSFCSWLNSLQFFSLGSYGSFLSFFVFIFDPFILFPPVLPSRRPEVTTSSTDYSVGETLTASCLSSKSKPAASLKWFINDIPVSTCFVPQVLSNSKYFSSCGRETEGTRGLSSFKILQA